MAWDAPKASTTDRGYGTAHQKLRRRWAQRIAQGGVTCWRCQQPLTPRSRWHLGHDDHNRGIYRGPEHATCNLRAASREANRRQRASRLTW